MSDPITPAGYPSAILKGDVVGRALTGVQDRLKALFPDTMFRHVLLPPHATRQTWETMTRDAPCVAVGVGRWKASRRASRRANNRFIGTLSFPLAIFQSLEQPEDLYLGTDTLSEIGVAGLMAAIAGGLNGWTLPGVGSCRVATIKTSAKAEWCDDHSVVVTAKLMFKGVTLDNIEALAALEDFVAGQEAILMKKESRNA
ncbi:hypothetical protein [Saccharibacter floricola]|uniref:Uncharacterized protein n=2 Tax=Saccharibacter TaxID=231052 RepID=A0ABQ0P1S2_9PROT|nr:hypothetical protein [Saccharibacter floricola]GBQ08933.1 hypothetical protein AA15669_1970 [Saccharibacter floricola DSM 15669]